MLKTVVPAKTIAKSRTMLTEKRWLCFPKYFNALIALEVHISTVFSFRKEIFFLQHIPSVNLTSNLEQIHKHTSPSSIRGLQTNIIIDFILSNFLSPRLFERAGLYLHQA